MTVDRNSIDRVLSLDDKSFYELASGIADAAGADASKKKLILGNIDVLRARLAQMTPRDAEQLIAAAGEEKSEEIAKLLRERGVDIGR